MKKILFLISILIVFSVLSIASSAHSGRTDSAGGHNVSGGGYHYHHGYPAHDHYDKDGDGIAEYCPYKAEKTTTKETVSKSDTTIRIDVLVFSIILSPILISIIMAAAAAFVTYKEKYDKTTANKIEDFFDERRILIILWIVSIVVLYVIGIKYIK